MTESSHPKLGARAVCSRGFLASSRRAAIGVFLSLCLVLIQPSTVYTQPLPPEGETAVEPHPQEFRVSAQHTFPLKLRISTFVDPYVLPSNLREWLGTLKWEVAGEGKLWEEDPGTLQLSFGTLPKLGDRDNFIEYRRPDLRAAFGEQRFSLSPLVRGDAGIGLDVQGTFQLVPELNLDTRALAYMDNGEGHLGLRMSAEAFSQAEASINVLADLSKPDTLLSGQLHLLPEIEGLETLDFKVEYGLHLSDASTRHAFDLNTKLTEGPHSVNLRYRRTEAGYRGASHHSSRLEASGKLQLSDEPVVNASMRLRREVLYEAQQPLSDKPERYTLQVGGTLSGNIRGIDLSFKYDNYNEVKEDTNRQRNTIEFSVGMPLADSFYMYQSLEWQQDSEEVLYETLLYSVEVDLPVLGGNLQPQAAVGYDLSESTFDTFSVGAAYFGLITDTFNLFAGSGLYLTDETFFYLIAGGSYGFEGGQALNFNASVFLFGESRPLVELGLGYSLPIDVPMGHSR